MAASPAIAQDRELAMQVGSILGSEEPCGLSYSAEGITAYIDREVAADDMEFLGMMDLGASNAEYSVGEMGAGQRAAHCAQTERLAKSLGFIE